MKVINSEHKIYIYYNEKLEDVFISQHEHQDISYPLVGIKTIQLETTIDHRLNEVQVESLESQRNRLIEDHVKNMEMIDNKMVELLSGS